MKSSIPHFDIRLPAAVFIAAASLLSFAAPSNAARPPVGRTYYTVMMGLASPYSVSTSCFEFGATSLCSTDDDSCGFWLPTDTSGRQGGFTFDMSLISEGNLVSIRGEGRVDMIGRKSSIGGTGRISGAGPVFNYSFAGREVPKNRCLHMLGEGPGGSEAGEVVIGSGTVSNEPRAVSDFSKVVFSGVGRLEIRHAGSESLIVRTEDNLLPYLRSEVRNGVLHVGNDAGINFRTNHEIVYLLSVTELDRLTMSGVTFADVRGVDTDLLAVEVSGVSAVEIRGRADRQRVTVAGVSAYDASGLRAATVDIDISGVSIGKVRVTDQLNGSVSGLSSLQYIGNPAVSVTVEPGCTLKRVG
jgi:hypothetical protein